MPALSVLKGKKGAFTHIANAQLHSIPNLTTCVLSNSFDHLVSLDISDCSLLGDVEGIKDKIRTTEIELMEKERQIKEAEELEANKRPALRTISDWNQLVMAVVEIISVGDGCCNEEGIEEMNLTPFVQLKAFSVGDRCFKNVGLLKIIGLKALEMITIGGHSFSKSSPSYSNKTANRQFFLKNCHQLKEMRIGVYSFCDYTNCHIENNESLSVIEVGSPEDETYSSCFFCSSFELKSMCIGGSFCIDNHSLRRLQIGSFSFLSCERVVIESIVLLRFVI